MTMVSVILPVLDGEKFIATAVESVLRQTHSEYETIVVDDGSRDSTADILRGYGRRIRVIAQENRGIAAARNRGLAAACGELVAFLDCDDLWEPNFLARTVGRLARAPGDVCGVVADWVSIDSGGRPIAGSRKGLSEAVGLDELLCRNLFPPSALLLRRAAVDAVGGFDEQFRRFGEDWDLFLRLCLAGYRFAPLRARLCAYRLHEGNTSADLSGRDASFRRVLQKLFAAPDLPAPLVAREAEVRSIHDMTMAALNLSGGRAEAGRDAFLRSVERWPAVLDVDETHWSIACSHQRRGRLGLAEDLDVRAGAARLEGLLRDCFARGMPPSPRRRRAAHARAYRCLAQMAYLAGEMSEVRRFAWRAWRVQGRLDARTCAAALKSLLGRRAADWRRRRLALGSAVDDE